MSLGFERDLIPISGFGTTSIPPHGDYQSPLMKKGCQKAFQDVTSSMLDP
jgi:hypothetical protein